MVLLSLRRQPVLDPQAAPWDNQRERKRETASEASLGPREHRVPTYVHTFRNKVTEERETERGVTWVCKWVHIYSVQCTMYNVHGIPTPDEALSAEIRLLGTTM